MPGSRIGEYFSVINFGESHGPAIGCVIDGCPPGMELSQKTFKKSSTGDAPEPHDMSHSAKKVTRSKFSQGFTKVKLPERRLRF